MQATCISLYHIQWLEHSEMLIEYSMDVDISWVCDDILHMEHWLGVECWIKCEPWTRVKYRYGG